MADKICEAKMDGKSSDVCKDPAMPEKKKVLSWAKSREASDPIRACARCAGPANDPATYIRGLNGSGFGSRCGV